MASAVVVRPKQSECNWEKTTTPCQPVGHRGRKGQWDRADDVWDARRFLASRYAIMPLALRAGGVT